MRLRYQSNIVSEFGLRIVPLKNYYVSAVHRARDRCPGLVKHFEKHSDRRLMLWLRSLFAIHDIEDMLRIDVAWWTLDAIAMVDNFLKARKDCDAFEFGSGASTIWLAKRCRSVTTVEHDSDFAGILSTYLSDYPNVTLLTVEPEPSLDADTAYASSKSGFSSLDFSRYAHSISNTDKEFDLIVIDGRARSACLALAVEHLSPEGIIVFDNSFRLRYRKAIRETNLHRKNTMGLTPCLPYPDATTLLCRSSTVLQELRTKVLKQSFSPG